MSKASEAGQHGADRLRDENETKQKQNEKRRMSAPFRYCFTKKNRGNKRVSPFKVPNKNCTLLILIRLL